MLITSSAVASREHMDATIEDDAQAVQTVCLMKVDGDSLIMTAWRMARKAATMVLRLLPQPAWLSP